MKQFEKELFSKSGVVLVGNGYKVSNGIKTDIMCKVVGVEKKVPESVLKDEDLIPVDIYGTLTDVIQVGKIEAFENVSRVRPLIPGYSIGHLLITAGTLGCPLIDNKDGQLVILSNNHVLANSNQASIDDWIIQPGTHDGGTSPEDNIGQLKRFVEITMGIGIPDCDIAKGFVAFMNAILKRISKHRLSTYTENGDAENLVDAAICSIREDIGIDRAIPNIGVIEGEVELLLDMQVHKQGRTTGYTVGEVSQTDVTVNVGYGSNQMATFTDQIIVSGDFSAGGDSGSAVLSGKYLGGLLFAGNAEQKVTVVNRIQNVLNLLDLSIP
jgi:hypothetical protein